MTNWKFVRSALGLVLAFFASTAAFGYTSFEEVDVLSTEPIFQLVEQRVPTEQCQIEYVSAKQPRFDDKSQTPGIIGALVGGAIGNAVGSEKSNQRVGAVAGALLGASIAKDVNRKRHEGQYEGTEREVCRTVYRTERAQEIIGYDVSYSYNGSVYTSRMDYDPGNTIRLRVNVTPAQ